MTLSPEQKICEECLGGRIRMLNRVVTKIYDEKLRPLGLRSSQIGILITVAAHGPLSQTQVCQRLQLEKSTLSRDLTRILAKGWIVSTADQGRRGKLEVTPAGRALIKKLAPVWTEAQAKACKLLGKTLINEIYRVADELQLVCNIEN